MNEREAVELIRANCYKRSLPQSYYHPDFFIEARWQEAWLDFGPSPAGNPGPYAKVPVTCSDSDRYVVRTYPKWRAWLRILRDLDTSTCRHANEGWPEYLQLERVRLGLQRPTVRQRLLTP